MQLFFKIIICTIIISNLLVSCGGVSENFSAQIKEVSGDGIFTMSPTGSQPVYRYIGKYDRVYFGYYNSLNEIKINYYDNNDRKIGMPVTLWSDWGLSSDGFLGDDHANPSIIVLANQKDSNQNGRILVASAEHGNRLQVRKSSFTESLVMWSQPILILDSKATYARLIELKDGTIWLISRLSRFNSNARATFFYTVSKDSGETWSEQKLLVDTNGVSGASSVYLSSYYERLSNRIHFVFNIAEYNNPVDGVSRYKDIYYANIDPQTDTWYNARSKVIGSSTLMISESDLVYKSSDSFPVEWTYLSDIKIYFNKNPYIYIVSINDPGRGDATYGDDNVDEEILRHHWDGTEWITNRVGRSARFSSYVNMATLDYLDADRIYGFTPNQNGYGRLTEFHMKRGIWSSKILSDSSDAHHEARIFSVIDAEPNYPTSKAAIFFNVIVPPYGESPYTEWTSRVQMFVNY